MPELLVDFITSLDGYGAAEGWPGWWGMQGPEYLAWLDEQPDDYTILMGANTYRLMSGFAESDASESKETTDEAASMSELTKASKVVFSSTLQNPLSWANTRLVTGDPVKAVEAMKHDGTSPMTTLGSLTLCRSLLKAGLVDRFRVVVFPVITGSTGRDRIYDGYPDVALDLVASRTFDARTSYSSMSPGCSPLRPRRQRASEDQRALGIRVVEGPPIRRTVNRRWTIPTGVRRAVLLSQPWPGHGGRSPRLWESGITNSLASLRNAGFRLRVREGFGEARR